MFGSVWSAGDFLTWANRNSNSSSSHLRIGHVNGIARKTETVIYYYPIPFGEATLLFAMIYGYVGLFVPEGKLRQSML